MRDKLTVALFVLLTGSFFFVPSANSAVIYYDAATTVNATRWDNTNDGDWAASTTNACNGTSWSDTLTGASQIKSKTAAINFSGYQSINVTFTYSVNALDAGEFLKFDVSNGSSVTNKLNANSNVACGTGSFLLDSTFNNNSNAVMNFTCNHNAGANERCIVDDIYVFGNTDSCTYAGSGDWNINAADGCTISGTVDVGGNSVIITGSGTVAVTGRIFDFKTMDVSSGSFIEARSGGLIG